MTRKEKIFQLAKGYVGRAKNCFRIAIRRVEKGLQYSYVSRRLKRREARREWITQVGAGSREHGLSYSRLIQGMNVSSIGVNRKMLAVLAREEPYSFRAIVEEAKASLKNAVLAGQKDKEPTVVPDADAPTTVDRGVLPRYDGPPLPPYPRRYKHFS